VAQICIEEAPNVRLVAGNELTKLIILKNVSWKLKFRRLKLTVIYTGPGGVTLRSFCLPRNMVVECES
jgi:hypothetical protein